MARDVKVEDVSDRDTGHRVTIYLDKEAGDFHAKFNGDSWRAATKEAVHKKVREALTKARSLDWKTVIGVTTGDEGGRWHHQTQQDSTFRSHAAALGLSFFRCDAARRPGDEGNKRTGGGWVIRPFLAPDGTCDLDLTDDETVETLDDFRRGQFEGSREGRLEDRKNNRDWHVPWWGVSDSPTLIPYSEEKWAALQSIRETITQTQQKMDKLLEADHIDKSLLAIHGRLTALLGSGEKGNGKLSKADLLMVAVRVPVDPKDWKGKRVKLKHSMRTKGGDEFRVGEVLVCVGVAGDGTLTLDSVSRKKGRGEHKHLLGIRSVDIEDVEFVP